jgi:hypothetical protein
VAHDAVDKPDREALETASSGIAMVDCARHNMKCANGVGDLQKGERYVVPVQRRHVLTGMVDISTWTTYSS